MRGRRRDQGPTRDDSIEDDDGDDVSACGGTCRSLPQQQGGPRIPSVIYCTALVPQEGPASVVGGRGARGKAAPAPSRPGARTTRGGGARPAKRVKMASDDEAGQWFRLLAVVCFDTLGR